MRSPLVELRGVSLRPLLPHGFGLAKLSRSLTRGEEILQRNDFETLSGTNWAVHEGDSWFVVSL